MVFQWSKTAASNATAATDINWREGQPPSSVNNSARELMSQVAEWRDDLGGALTTSGTTTAYTLTTNQAFTSFSGGEIIGFTAHATSTGNITLSVNGTTAANVVDHNGTQLGSGALVINGRYLVTRRSTTWQLISDSPRASSATIAGVVELATDAEALTGTDTARAITPANLDYVFDNRPADFSVFGTMRKAANSEIWSAALGSLAVTAEKLSNAAAFQSLTDGATISFDWEAGINRSLTIAGNRTLGNPSNGQPGTHRQIYVVGDSGTQRQLQFAANFAGDTPVLNDITSSRGYLLSIACISTGHFVVSAHRAS